MLCSAILMFATVAVQAECFDPEIANYRRLFEVNIYLRGQVTKAYANFKPSHKCGFEFES